MLEEREDSSVLPASGSFLELSADGWFWDRVISETSGS
jgi:hypothetical protein